jgi:predicted transcriptional regulator
MKKRNVKVIAGTGTVEEFFKRAHEDARKMDRGELLPPEIRVTFEDPIEMLRALSAERMRVIKTVRKHHATKPTVSRLALMLKRDRKSVSRDVKVLESFGLLKTREQPNPGHGMMKVVESLAGKYYLTATV